MSWAKREAVSNLVVLGDDEGQKKKVGGLLVGMPRDQGYPDKVNYQLVQKDGEVALLSGSASLARQINEHDVGKFIKCEFQGWGRSGNGKFKVIEVNVWEGEPNDEMKAWPRFAEFQNGGKKQAPKAAPVAAGKKDEFDGFPPPLEDTDDDLPFSW